MGSEEVDERGGVDFKCFFCLLFCDLVDVGSMRVLVLFSLTCLLEGLWGSPGEHMSHFAKERTN